MMRKSVKFDELKNSVHVLVVWAFAYRRARKFNFEEFTNKIHFKRRIENMDNILKPILNVNYRNKVYNERFNTT